MFVLVARRTFKIIFRYGVLDVLVCFPPSTSCFLPFPSNLISHFFVFFSSSCLHSPSILALLVHPRCVSLQSSKSHSSCTTVFHVCPSCLPSLLFFLPTPVFPWVLSSLPHCHPWIVGTTLAKWLLGNFLALLSLQVSTPTHVHILCLIWDFLVSLLLPSKGFVTIPSVLCWLLLSECLLKE